MNPIFGRGETKAPTDLICHPFLDLVRTFVHFTGFWVCLDFPLRKLAQEERIFDLCGLFEYLGKLTSRLSIVI